MVLRKLLPLALSCVLLSGCLGGEEADQIEQRIIEEDEVIPPDPEEVKRQKKMEQAALELKVDMGEALSPVEGIRGAAVTEVGSMNTILAGHDVPMAQQSVSKLWVNLTIAEMVAQGRMNYSDPVIVTHNDRAVFHQPLARRTASGPVRTTIGELMTMAITKSDNMANQVLMELAGGPSAVQNWLFRHRPQIRFGPGDRIMQSAISGLEWSPSFGDRKSFQRARDAVPAELRTQRFKAYADDPIDGASPSEMSKALAAMHRGEYPNSRDVVSLMEKTVTGRARLKAGTPAGWKLMHKTGTGQNWRGRTAGFNDVGLLQSPDGRTYAVAVLIGNSSSAGGTMQKAIADVARAVVTYHEKTQECCSRSL